MIKTIWNSDKSVAPHDIGVVVAYVDDQSVSISEETSTSSQQVSCKTVEIMEALHIYTEEELMNELEKRFGNPCGYDIARQFMEENGIEFHWWGGSN